MSTIQVDTFLFNFKATVSAQKYDTWQHYATVWNLAGGQKAMDLVAIDTPPAPSATTTWLIEAKDFRVLTNPPSPSSIAGLAQTVADKSTHTIAGLTHAAAHARIPSEQSHAASAIAAPVKRIVLHLEPHTGPRTALFPAGFAASVLQRLRQLVKSIDPNPLVLNIANTPSAGVPWTVA